MELIDIRLKLIEDRITNKEFLKAKRIAGEVPFYIFDYSPNYELKVRDNVEDLLKKLKEYYKIKVERFNLYELYIEIMNNRDIVESAIEREEEIGSEKLGDILIPMIEGADLAKIIGERGRDAELIILDGVGSVYPLIRSHSTLNTLQPIFNDNDKPILMLFPGTYDTKGLSLFNIFPSDHYYRAFKLVEDEVSEIEKREIELETEIIIENKKEDKAVVELNLSDREVFIIKELKDKKSLYEGELSTLLIKTFGRSSMLSGVIQRINRKILDSLGYSEFIIHEIIGENNRFTYNEKYISFEVKGE